ncbi:MAG TPA: hypothetical protein VGN44_16780 [Candidatus Angelobacter sp.]|jgi:hypothetical protein
MSQEAIIVFTARSVERILNEGGSASWRLDRNHARRCAYAVCTRNTLADWTEGQEEHRSAFLVGKISNVIPCAPTPENHEAPNNRYLIQFSEFARVNVLDTWKGDRNPVKYTTLEELGINFSKLKWEAMPKLNDNSAPITHLKTSGIQPLTMAQAKQGLALTFNVAPEAIEITIRG